MNENELLEFENRQYVNPDISRDEQTDFINTLRDIQAQNNAQIATETHNLGTDIDHPRGGLNGSEEYWKGRYQTPQTEAAIANMKAVAQQSALNTALSNYNNMLQNRYNQAYRDYNKRLYEHNRSREREADARAKAASSSSGGSNDNSSTWTGETEKIPSGNGGDTVVSRITLNLKGVPYTKEIYADGSVRWLDFNGNQVEDPSPTPPKTSDYTVTPEEYAEGSKSYLERMVDKYRNNKQEVIY